MQESLSDSPEERLGGVRRRNLARDFAPFGRKDVFQPLDKELLASNTIHAILPLWPVE